MIRSLCLLGLFLATSAHVDAGPEAAVPAATTAWHRLATDPDRKRLREWRKTWISALKQVSPGHQNEIDAQGPLLDPDAALADVEIKPGDYRCRTIKLGAKGKTNLPYVAYPASACSIGAIEGKGTMGFALVDGPQRPVGRLFPDDRRRMVFLGTLQLGDEKGVLRYGHDKQRDMIGMIERVGPKRWRLVLPSPAFESLLDVVELTPAS